MNFSKIHINEYVVIITAGKQFLIHCEMRTVIENV
jgi:hypothetical protein